MNKVDCTVLDVIDVKSVKIGDFEWVKDDWNIYRVKAVSWGYEFDTNVCIKEKDDKGQVKKGYVFQE